MIPKINPIKGLFKGVIGYNSPSWSQRQSISVGARGFRV